MVPGALQKVKRGDPLVVPALTFNASIDAAQAAMTLKIGVSGPTLRAAQTRSNPAGGRGESALRPMAEHRERRDLAAYLVMITSLCAR